MIWVKKKTGAPVIRLSSLDAAEEILRRHQIFIMGYFENYEVCNWFAYIIRIHF